MALVYQSAPQSSLTRSNAPDQQWRDAEVERQRAEASEDGCGRGITIGLFISLACYGALALLAFVMGWL